MFLFEERSLRCQFRSHLQGCVPRRKYQLQSIESDRKEWLGHLAAEERFQALMPPMEYDLISWNISGVKKGMPWI